MREAADRYHVSVMTLRRRIRTGTLPAVHCGSKLIRIPAQALDAIFTPVPNSNSWVS
jgi:excisionase family DNA binding protein